MNHSDNDDEWLEQGRSLKKKTDDAGCFTATVFVSFIILIITLVGAHWF